MSLINYISVVAMPIVIFIIIGNALREKVPVFDLFLKGAKDGLEIVLKIFPTLIGLFVAIGMLRSSGVIDFITRVASPVTSFFMPNEILPLAILRPISGSASMAVATDIIKMNGVDSFIGVLAAVIMGSTETTLYTIAVYSSSVKAKNTRFVLFASLIADITGETVSVIIVSKMFG